MVSSSRVEIVNCQNKINTLVENLDSGKQSDIINFFKDIEKRLLKKDQDKPKLTQSEFWLNHQFLPEKFNNRTIPIVDQENYDKRVTNRVNQIDIFDEGKPTMHRKRLDIKA